MWVEKTKEGTYKYRERFTDPVTGKSKTLSITLSKNNASSKKEALIALQEKYKSLLEFKKDITLIELRTLYLEWQKRQVKASTYRRNEGSTNSIMKILGKDTLANILSAGYVKKAFVNSGKSNATLNEYLKRFKAWMNWAYKNDYIEDVSFLDKIDYLKDTTRKDKLIDTISRLLGHENSKITKDIYLHVTEKLKKKDFELIRQIKVL